MGINGSLYIILHGLIWWKEFTKQFWSLHSVRSIFSEHTCSLNVKLKVLMLMFNLIDFDNCLSVILSNSTSAVHVFGIFTCMITLTRGLQSHFQTDHYCKNTG